MGLFSMFDRTNPKTELEGIERAQALLNERFEKKQVPNEVYVKQCEEFRKRREKCEKKLGIGIYDKYN